MKENIIADIDSIISTKESMDGYYNELLSMINQFQEIIEDTQNIYYTESATLYRKIAINYIESVRNYINNDFKEFIDRIDKVKSRVSSIASSISGEVDRVVAIGAGIDSFIGEKITEHMQHYRVWQAKQNKKGAYNRNMSNI